MNKRLLFILLPFLSLLSFLNNGEGRNHVFQFRDFHQKSFLIKSVQTNNNSSSVLNKDNQDRNRNKIRIKACDDFATINFNEHCLDVEPVLFYTKVGYSKYVFYFQSTCLFSNSLRGPPVA